MSFATQILQDALGKCSRYCSSSLNSKARCWLIMGVVAIQKINITAAWSKLTMETILVFGIPAKATQDSGVSTQRLHQINLMTVPLDCSYLTIRSWSTSSKWNQEVLWKMMPGSSQKAKMQIVSCQDQLQTVTGSASSAMTIEDQLTFSNTYHALS